MSKIKKITVSNLKAISSQTADFNGCTAIVTGGNNKGKTTFLKSLPDRLAGIKPDVILKHGESEGFSEWELTTGEKFIWSFENRTKAGEKLTFITSDNIKTSLTKDISNRYFPETFDIDKFLSDSPSKQKQALQDICGLDFTDIDTRYKSAFENRADKNREAAKAKLLPVIVDSTLGAEEKPLDDIQLEILGVDNHNEKIAGVENGLTSRGTKHHENEQEIARIEAEIVRLQTTIENTKAENVNLAKQITDGLTWLKLPNNQKKSEEDAQALQDRLQARKNGNAKIRTNNANKINAESLKVAELAANAADNLVKSIVAEKETLIKSANMPEGFAFNDDGITFEGFALDKKQLSSSKIYIAALKLAAMKTGEVRTLHFDASYLDKNSLHDIEEWAAKEDLQLLIERPAFEGGEIEYQLTAI